ncbi:ThuA domain-containing protein [Akkermansiaceae bacterium]|nr:ThuA domain-containing protein [Akkermansiaceae bacterium]
MKRTLIWPLAILFALLGALFAQKKGKGGSYPNEPIPKSEVMKLTGDLKDAKLERDVNILWLYGPEDHRGGEHDYIRIKELFVPMLKSIPRITVDEAYQFPTQEQFDEADLLIQYLHLPDLTDEQFAMYQKFVDVGGSVVSIHESCIMRPVDRAEKLAACIGGSWKGNQTSKWSKFDHARPLYLKTDHPAFKGLPAFIKLNDESYWNLLKKDNVEVIAAIAPADTKDFDAVLKHPEVRSDAFWTYTSGKGRVFGTTTGHYTYTFHDPLYRVLLIRGMAWALNIDPAPLMSLATQGITDDKGFVGTKDSMMDYKNRKR